MRALSVLVDVVALPDFRAGTWRTFRRQIQLSRYRPGSELLSIVIEPLLLLLALSWGLGYWLKEIDGRAYPQFVLPAVAVFCLVFVPYWEVAFGTFNRLRKGQTYWVALQGPIGAVDLANGELLWGAVKGCAAAAVILFIGFILGWLSSPMILLAPLVLLPGALLFAAVGMWCGVHFRKPTQLILVQGLVLGPLCLWSDTLFPFSRMGLLADWAVFFSPVGHMSNALRMLSLSEISADFFLSLAILWTLSCIVANAAAIRFSRRLIPS